MTQYLILHKVRGEPAFDIAEEIERELWIIPTSGHRAYPYKMWELTDLEDNLGRGYFEAVSWVPPDWPDHYAVNDRPTQRLADTITQVGSQKLSDAIMAKYLSEVTPEELDSILSEVLENRK